MLLFGMMVIVSIFSETGFFDSCALQVFFPTVSIMIFFRLVKDTLTKENWAFFHVFRLFILYRPINLQKVRCGP